MSGSAFPSSGPLVVEVVRGSLVESESPADAVVVEIQAGLGSVLAVSGDANRVAYFRSTLKPIQAAVCIEQGWRPRNPQQIAVAAASHNAEPAHLEVVRSIFADAGLSESALRCPPALPLLDLEAARAGEPKPILRDCSGKHAAFLATCVVRGWPLETYLNPEHPLQQAVLCRTRELCGSIEGVGVDGCGAPAPATSLAAIAFAFGAGLAAAPAVGHAMQAEPFLVAGTGRICTDVMLACPGIVMKAGAEGIVCGFEPASGRAFAVKALDGWPRYTGPVVLEVLAWMGALPLRPPSSLDRHMHPAVLGGGLPAGRIQIRR